MSRDFSRGAVAALALALLSPTPVLAEDDLVDHAKKAQATKQSIGNKVDAIAEDAVARKERALEAAQEAKERALEAADEAKSRSREAADSLQERAEEATANAKAYAEELKSELGRRTQKLGEDAKGMVAGAKAAFKNAIQSARDEAREILLNAAVALDNRTRDARKAARNEHWTKLKARYGLPDHAPSMELSEELRDHEYRLARLARARELAESGRDEQAVAQSDRLLELEYARHRRRLKRLIEKDRSEQAMHTGEALSYGDDAP
ncbi:MAG TPA: hypothetical protein VI299_23585 [Polyangiales bacterium]